MSCAVATCNHLHCISNNYIETPFSKSTTNLTFAVLLATTIRRILFSTIQASPMSYNVYHLDFTSMPLNHQGIFVETEANHCGFTFHVTGSTKNGMTFEIKTLNEPPENEPTFNKKTKVGVISVADFGKLEPILRSVPPPAKQFNGFKRIDPSKPLRTCQEWSREAIEKLKEEGILKCEL